MRWRKNDSREPVLAKQGEGKRQAKDPKKMMMIPLIIIAGIDDGDYDDNDDEIVNTNPRRSQISFLGAMHIAQHSKKW